MLRLLRKPLIIFSVGLNVAFVAIWLIRTVPDVSVDNTYTKIGTESSPIPSALYREIDVTREQWEQLEPYIMEFRDKAKRQRSIIETHRNQLMELLANHDTDESEIRAKQEEILSGQRWMQDIVIDFLLKESEYLTPEQQRSLMELIHQQCASMKNAGNSTRGIGRVLIEEESP